MTFSFLKKQRKNETLSLLIDIGSASVGAALLETENGKAPHLLVSTRENIVFQEKLSPLSFLRAMNKALERVLKISQTKLKNTGAPTHIFCSLSSPWFLLKSRHLSIARQEPFEITTDILDKLLDDGITRLTEDLKGTLPSEDMRIVERKIIQTKLNGYEIKNPYGQKASRVELVMSVGISSRQVIERIEHTVQNFFHSTPMHFSAFPVAAFSAIRDIFPTEKSFLFLDITGEGTDVSLVSNELLIDTIAFPRGKNYFVREISAQFRIPHEGAASVLNMFLVGTLDPVRQKGIETLMARIQQEWLARLEKIFSSLGMSGILPRKVFFMADADVSELFTRTLGQINGAFDVHYIDQLTLGKFVSVESGTVADPFLIAEALLVSKIVPQIKQQ